MCMELWIYDDLLLFSFSVIGLKSFHPLKPEYSIDTSRVKSCECAIELRSLCSYPKCTCIFISKQEQC